MASSTTYTIFLSKNRQVRSDCGCCCNLTSPIQSINIGCARGRYPMLVEQLRATIPRGAPILSGTYLAGSGKEGDAPHGQRYVHWMTPASVELSMRQAAQLYSAGKTSGHLLFAGEWMAAPPANDPAVGMNATQWHRYQLPVVVGEAVWAHSGEVEVHVVDARGRGVPGALVSAFLDVNNATFVARKLANASGAVNFGAYAGVGGRMVVQATCGGGGGEPAFRSLGAQSQQTIVVTIQLSD
jgi:hypothetical protein|eukprot:COSAG01_NODE_1834_length_9105_cov_35.595603_2_plen_241_part_00